MILAPHWDMREYMHELTSDDNNPRAHKGARLPVLLQFMLYANQRLRCWVSTETLCRNTGLTARAVVEARHWLLDHRAFILVPYDKRSGKTEKQLPHRQQIYQLTGVLQLPERIVPYILMSPEMFQTVTDELESIEGENGYTKTLVLKVSHKTTLPFNQGKDGEVVKGETSDGEVSEGAAEGISTSEGIEEKNTAPQNGAGGSPLSDSQKSKRSPARSLIFKELAAGSFKIFDVDDLKDRSLVIRINALEKWLKQNSAGATEVTVRQFYIWYDSLYSGAARPRDVEKFGLHFMAFRQKHLGANHHPKAAPPAVPAPVILTDEEKRQRIALREAAQADLQGAG